MGKILKSEGFCLYGNQLIAQKEMGKHLAKHVSEREKKEVESSPVNYCHIEVEAEEMFLYLLVRGDSKMKTIDNFLKAIWLECCGHLTTFGHKQFKVSMSHRVEDVMEPRVKIYQDYDFGSTTRVYIGIKALSPQSERKNCSAFTQ